MIQEKFTKNIHQIERVLRVVVGSFLLSLIFWGPETAWGFLGLIPFTTGLMGYCPAYSLFGISTCKRVNPKCDLGTT